MVRVTDKNFYMDDRLYSKINLMIKRCTQPNPKKDNVLLIEGGEGEGKSNLSFQVAYLVSYKTGRSFTSKNIFFKADKLLEFAQNTENQIIIYDEPSLDMLGAEWYKKEQLNIIKLLMTARKKRHFFIFNITKFYKFAEYIVVDRAIGMIHVYSRNEIEPGRFVYIRKKSIEWMYRIYRRSKQRTYKKYTSFRGTFPDFPEGIIDTDSYERKKNYAIMSIGTKKEDIHQKKLNELRYKIANLSVPIQTKKELAEKLETDPKTIRDWRQYDPPRRGEE